MEYHEQKITLKLWAEEDRPREKLVLRGRRGLTDAELIAILINSGSRTETAVELSKRILHFVHNDLDKLGRVSVTELSKFKGIGPAKAISIIAALELGRRRKETEVPELEKIATSQDIYDLLKTDFEDLNHEEFWIILLNRASKVLSKCLVSKGGQSGTVADPKIIFQLALENHATSIILAHNHPSGNLKPSQADISLTHKLCSAGAMLDVAILDHLIFANSRFFSFADEGII